MAVPIIKVKLKVTEVKLKVTEMKLIVTEVKLIVTEVKATSENGSDNGSKKEVIRQFDVETLIYNFFG